MKRLNFDFSGVSQIDWARLAAFIDGEGCISIKTVKGNREASRRVCYLDVSIANTDVRLTEWLKCTFGGSVYVDNARKTKNPKWSNCFKWNVASRHAASLLEHAQPYFIIKREQVATALAFQRTVLPDRRYGVKGRPEEVIDQQHAFKQQLSDLKGTSSRNSTTRPTIN